MRCVQRTAGEGVVVLQRQHLGPRIDLGSTRPFDAVDAVAADHQIDVQVGPRIWHLVLKKELHAELASMAL